MLVSSSSSSSSSSSFPTIITASNSNSSKAEHTVKGVREVRGATLVVCGVTLCVILIVGLR